MEKEISIVIRMEGGEADNGRLDIHDAADAILGMARSINIVNHSFANDEVIRTRANSATGSKSYIHASLKGCFEEQIDISFNKKTVAKMGASVITSNYWDYLAYCWAAAVGKSHRPQTSHLRKVIDRHEGFGEEIATALEVPMRNLLRPILTEPDIKIMLARPRVSDVLTFDSDSLEYVSTIAVNSETEYIQGNVTRYNVLSNYGRLFSDEEQRIVSFQLLNANQNPRARGLAIASMKQKVEGEEGKLHFKVAKIITANGHVKRYLVHDILEVWKK